MATREYSNGLQHLKFMQRAKQREEAVKKAEETAVADESHWVVPVIVGSGRRCAVIVEGDPRPGALLGRMSFQNCNASVDKLVEEAETIHKRRFSVAKEKAESASGAPSDSIRSDSWKEEDTSALTPEAEESVQFKKPKVGATSTLADGGRGAEWRNSGRNDSKTWQGWRGQGDYRVLKPPPK